MHCALRFAEARCCGDGDPAAQDPAQHLPFAAVLNNRQPRCEPCPVPPSAVHIIAQNWAYSQMKELSYKLPATGVVLGKMLPGLIILPLFVGGGNK